MLNFSAASAISQNNLIRKMCLTHSSLTPVLLREVLKYLMFWAEKCEEIVLRWKCKQKYIIVYTYSVLQITFTYSKSSSQNLISNSYPCCPFGIFLMYGVFSTVGIYSITSSSVLCNGDCCFIHLLPFTPSAIRSLPPRHLPPSPSLHLSLEERQKN